MKNEIEIIEEQLTGSQIVIEALKRENTEVVFGYPGGAIMHVYDEIYKQDFFQHILVKHEQAAIHAAGSESTSRIFEAFSENPKIYNIQIALRAPLRHRAFNITCQMASMMYGFVLLY